MQRLFSAALVALALAVPLKIQAANSAPPSQQFMSKLRWRNIGPFIGGRVVAVAGVPSNQNLFYMGGVQGGIWRSTNYGQNWTNISDHKLPGVASPIGALAVAPSNPNVIYAGTGEADIRGDFDTGDGIYKTTDAGKTWSYAGLRDTHTITKIAIDLRDPNVAYAASAGHVFKANSERGIFNTTDGGKTWRRVLFVDENTGGVDLVMNPRDSKVLYAAMWQAQRVPWKLTSGGPGSGLYKTSDGGAHWKNVSSHPGFAGGMLGKIGVSVAPTNPNIVYAIVQARDGGVFRSNDAGATWKRVNDEMKLRQRAFYYMAIFADPRNPQVAYVPQVDGVYKTKNGGKSFSLIELPHGDDHILWVNPHDAKIILEGDDGGATVTVDGGVHWSSEGNQPTGQYYHVALDDQFPFHVFGAAQDEGAYEGPSAALGGGIRPGEWHSVALGESTFVAPEPESPDVTYGSGYYSAFVRFNRVLGQEKNVSPWPRYMTGASSGETKYRFGWTHPVFFSPADPRELLVAAQVVFSSTDRGQSWSILSPDLTRNDPRTEGPSGGPIDYDQTGAETFPDISSLAASPLDANILWAGSADGLVHVTTDHGARWTPVTPPQLPQWAQISSIEPSHTEKGAAYLTASRYMWDDYHPYVYETTDFGAHWISLINGLAADQYVFAVRQDPRERRLLFAGTRSTAYVSLDGGAQWQPLALNLPGVQVRDLAIDAHEGELVAATHGRAFWILDDLALLEQLARQTTFSVADAQIFAPETAWLTQAYGATDFPVPNLGANPRYGATVYFNVPHAYTRRIPLTLSFLDAKGAMIRSFTLHPKDKTERKLTPEEYAELDVAHQRAHDLDELTAVKAGMNAFQWDLRYAPGYDMPGFRTVDDNDFPDASDGPTILPGAYTVVLHYGAKTMHAPMNVQLDPRIHPAAGDLEARLALETQILGSMDGLDRAIAAAMVARSKLPAANRAQLDREIASLVQFDNRSSEADVLHETKIREQLGFLMNSLESAYQRPTVAEYATYEDLKALAAAGEANLHEALK
ncbi:MAG: glycosyl hydrolase [Candidatus Tumulicola sp.]